jgi:14-3-3 protein epsilon
MADRDTNIYMAKLAEQAERYDEMVDYMKAVSNESPTECPLQTQSISLLF